MDTKKGETSTIKEIDKLKPAEFEATSAFASGKSALLIVHPYYGYDPANIPEENNEPKDFERFINSGRHEKYLTIVMDEHKRLAELRTRFPKANNLFFLETRTAQNPVPMTRGRTAQAGWQKLVKILLLLKIKKTIVGGRTFSEKTLSRAREYIAWRQSLPRRIANKGDMTKSDLANAKAVVKVLQTEGRSQGKVYGCAGLTTTRLKATRRFRVKTTRHFS